MNKSTRHLVIKDYSKLEQYGFVKQGSSYYFYTGNNGKYGKPIWTIHIDSRANGGVPYICSHGNITLEVICRMYADGVLAFENNNSKEIKIAKVENQIKKLEAKIEKLKEELLWIVCIVLFRTYV